MPLKLGTAAIAALLLVIWAQYHSLGDSRARVAELERIRAGQDATIDSMIRHAEHNAAATELLARRLQTSQALLHQRSRQWEQLKREHQDLKAWAESALPESVGRLHRRPALTGADGYHAWLQQGDGLRPATEPAAHP